MSDIQTNSFEQGVFTYGDELIEYEVIRKAPEASSEASQGAKKSNRKIVIKVHPNQRVVVTTPHDASNTAIQLAVLKRARWISTSLQEFSAQQDYVLPKEYVSGETQFYLGRRYLLKVSIDTQVATNVKLQRGRLEVTLNNDKEQRSKQVKIWADQWYLHRAEIIFHERLQEMLPKATWVTGVPSFRIMAMKKQWGSCSKKGSLMLNPHLVKAPKECIDYVILHELCHISEHNHSTKFWRLLTQVMPNWKEVKGKLDDMAELYLNE